MRFTEDIAKGWLRKCGLPVPDGAVAKDKQEAFELATELGGAVAIKALIPSGRRGKGGAVHLTDTPIEAAIATDAMIGQELVGHRVERVYIERRASIARELYLSFACGTMQPEVVLSQHGGVDIEDTFIRHPATIIRAPIDVLRGLKSWEGIALWERAGIDHLLLPRLGLLTTHLYDAFCKADGLMLEINPLALDQQGVPMLVGTMLEVDDNALFRHPEWSDLPQSLQASGRLMNERERMVLEADRRIPGGAVRYTELDGDIGLMVAGGGAGLLQHDLIVAAGGHPANHSDYSPSSSLEKPAVVFDAIFSNPNTRSLLIGFNHLQMAPCDTLIRALLISMERNHVNSSFPIVVRLFGPKEEEARNLANQHEGIRYLSHGASFAEAVREIVGVTKNTRQGASAT